MRSAGDGRAAAAASWDAIVVGAGPAGAVAARELAAAGRRVLLLERERLPRYKTCGGGLVWRARRALGEALGLDLGDAVERECRLATIGLLDAGLEITVERPAPIVSMTMRSALDLRLVAAARAAGAVIADGTPALAVATVAGGLEIRTPAGSERTRYLIVASGAAGRLAGLPRPRSGVPALESEIRVTPARFERFAAAARFDFGALPGGYAWVFPKRDHLSVGCLGTRRGGPPLRAALAGYLQRLGLDPPLAREDHGFVIPIRPRPRTGRPGVLAVGDAAGLADPLTGEGISWAIESGRLAARAIAAPPEEPAAAAARYAADLARHVLPELWWSRRIAPLLYRGSALRSLAFRRAGRPLAEVVTDVFMGERSYRSLLGRPALWLRLLGHVAAGRG